MAPENKSSLFNTLCLENLINEPTCLKSATRFCIGLIPTNKKLLFMRSGTFESGLSEFDKVTNTILRKTIATGNPKTILYRD